MWRLKSSGTSSTHLRTVSFAFFHIGGFRGCFTLSTHLFVSLSDFPLTLARWPMASEHCWQTSDFLSYWPRMPSGISIIVKNFKKKEKLSCFLEKISRSPKISRKRSCGPLLNQSQTQIHYEISFLMTLLICAFPFKEHTSKEFC